MHSHQWSINDLKDHQKKHGLNITHVAVKVHVKRPVLVVAMLISVRNTVAVTLNGVEIDSKGVNANVVQYLERDAPLGNVHVWLQGGNVILIYANYVFQHYIIRMNQGINAIILDSNYDRNEEY